MKGFETISLSVAGRDLYALLSGAILFIVPETRPEQIWRKLGINPKQI